jgi:energy-coupling factor transporter ATP-binding protein EcfA2
MILKKFEYSEFTGEPNAWSLNGLVLENINLLVGKNATGKTNALRRIFALSSMLSGSQPQLFAFGNYDVEFNDNYKYKLNLSQHRVESEELIINSEEKFKRDSDGKGQIWAEKLSRKIDFQVAPNKLVVTSKNDAIQHPFLEELIKWAESLKALTFSSKMGQESLFYSNTLNINTVEPDNMNSVGLYKIGEQEFPDMFKKRIIDSMKEIGYELEQIELDSVLLHNNTYGWSLYIVEKNSENKIYQPFMSQGMFRALSIIIQLTYHTMKKLSGTILIDDIGEGLDFERSSKLIKLLIKLAEENDTIQLIMSTNDRYVMNNVPLEYWQVIQRIGGECRVFNYHNSKEKFDDFQYMGLNNFDFLATDFLNTEWEKI